MRISRGQLTDQWLAPPPLVDTAKVVSSGVASDSPSLARWWRAFCSGELVSKASLTEMSTFVDGPESYGLGLFSPTGTYPASVGHVGGNFGYVSWAGCLLDEGAVVVVLSNVEFEDISGMASPLVDAVIAD